MYRTVWKLYVTRSVFLFGFPCVFMRRTCGYLLNSTRETCGFAIRWYVPADFPIAGVSRAFRGGLACWARVFLGLGFFCFVISMGGEFAVPSECLIFRIGRRSREYRFWRIFKRYRWKGPIFWPDGTDPIIQFNLKNKPEQKCGLQEYIKTRPGRYRL